MRDKIAIGGEEGAVLSIRQHVPEKDALLAELPVLRNGGLPPQIAERAIAYYVTKLVPIARAARTSA